MNGSSPLIFCNCQTAEFARCVNAAAQTERHQEVRSRTVATDAPEVWPTSGRVSVTIWAWCDPQLSASSTRRQCIPGLSNCCIPVAQVATRRRQCPAARRQLTVPRHRLSTYKAATHEPTLAADIDGLYGRRAFAVVQRSARWSARSLCQHSNLRTIVEDTCPLPISTFSVPLNALCATYLLTYCVTNERLNPKHCNCAVGTIHND